MAINSLKLATLSFYIAASAIEKECVLLQQRKVVASVSPDVAGVAGEVELIRGYSEQIGYASQEAQWVASEIQPPVAEAGVGNFAQPSWGDQVTECLLIIQFGATELVSSYNNPSNMNQVLELQSRINASVNEIQSMVAAVHLTPPSPSPRSPAQVEELVDIIHWLATDITMMSDEIHYSADEIQFMVTGTRGTALLGIHSIVAAAAAGRSSPGPTDALERLHYLSDGLHYMADELHFLLVDQGLDDRVFVLIRGLHEMAEEITSDRVCGALCAQNSMSVLDELVNNIHGTAEGIAIMSAELHPLAEEIRSAVAEAGAEGVHQTPAALAEIKAIAASAGAGGSKQNPDAESEVERHCDILHFMASEMVPILVDADVNEEEAFHVQEGMWEIIEEIRAFAHLMTGGNSDGGNSDGGNSDGSGSPARVADLVETIHWIAGDIQEMSQELHPMAERIPNLLAAMSQNPVSLAGIQSKVSQTPVANDAYGSDGHGSDGHGSDGHGSDAYGCDGYGCDGYGCDGYGCDAYEGYGCDAYEAYGCDAYGSDGHGSDGHGSDSHGCDAYEGHGCDAHEGNGCDAYEAYGCDAYGSDSHASDGYGCDAYEAYGCDAHVPSPSPSPSPEGYGCDAYEAYGCDAYDPSPSPSPARAWELLDGFYRICDDLQWVVSHSGLQGKDLDHAFELEERLVTSVDRITNLLMSNI